MSCLFEDPDSTNKILKNLLNGCISSEFTVSNDVKQSAVLSPLLFAVYLDDVLKDAGVECHLNVMFIGAFLPMTLH